MSNDIIGRVNAMYDMKIEDDHIVDIIQGRSTTLSAEVQEVVFATVRSYANGILDKLRELQVDLRANPAIFIGGGSILFQNFIEESSQVAQADFVLDSKANAIGYGMLATGAVAADDTAESRRGVLCGGMISSDFLSDGAGILRKRLQSEIYWKD